MKKLTRAAAAAFAGAILLSCGGGGESTAPKPVLTTLTVSFPNPSILVGQTANASASGVDQFAKPIATGTITWTIESSSIATVNANGAVTGVAVGQTHVIASAGGKQGQATVNVVPIPVATVTVSPGTASVVVGATQQLTATTLDESSNVLTGRAVTWTSSDPSRATVDGAGMVTGVGIGVANISATSEGKTGMAQIAVTAAPVSCSSTLQLAVGEIHTLTAAEKASLCVGIGGSASEYVLIPFNSSDVAASTIAIQVSGTNTSAIQPGTLASLQPNRSMMIGAQRAARADSIEIAFRRRERRDVQSLFGQSRRRGAITTGGLAPRSLTGIPANPTVGSVFDINANLTGNTCTSAKQMHGAVVVAVLPHTIILSDTLSPAGGYTAAEMAGFGQAFDTLGYALDVQNFGSETDIDGNGRVAILFTPGVNAIPGPPGGYVGGLFAGRDLAPIASCVGSNEGEMFYMPVPDPNKTINGNYASKSTLANGNLGTLVHEFQHLINAGRRAYVNNASSFEEVWLNEGLSHIAEELLYYRISGNAPRTNIDVSVLTSNQAQLNAANAYILQNMGRLSTYMQAPEINSPFAQNDNLETRGATWQLLRYSADRRGGVEKDAWSGLVNSITAGQTNFNAIFGDIIASSRDWSVAQFLDDAGLTALPNYLHPSWNYRSVLPPINTGNKFPLATRALVGPPVGITLNGGGAAYLRFSVAAGVTAAIGATSSGQPVPSAVDFILVRTQ